MHFSKVLCEEWHHSLSKRIPEQNKSLSCARVARDEMHLVNLSLSLGRERPFGRKGDILIVEAPRGEQDARGHIAAAIAGGNELVFIERLDLRTTG